jgi:hypothetical protein
MKAQSASVTLYHIQPGQHRAVCMWHDADHKAEVIGTMPHVFISQRWVTPPDWAALRSPTDLPHRGGEYVNIYWSSGSPEEMERDFAALGDRLERAGRMEPTMSNKMQRVWPSPAHSRLRPVSIQTRSGLDLSGEAVTASTANTGLVLVVGEVLDGAERDEFARWHQSVFVPMVLDTGAFAGAAELMFDGADQRNTFVTLYYTDLADPTDAYREFSRLSADERQAGDLPGGPPAHRTVLSTVARPSIGQYDFYD